MDILNRITTYKNASIAAYCVAALNIIPVALTLILENFISNLPTTSGIGVQVLDVLAILLNLAPPILTLLVVRMLPCNPVARYCGYGAQVIFIISSFANTNVPVFGYLFLFGVLANLIWIGLASWQSKGSVMIVGLCFVFLYVISGIIDIGIAILVVYLLNGVWFFLVARLLGKISNVPPLLDEVDAPADTDDSPSEVTL